MNIADHKIIAVVYLAVKKREESWRSKRRKGVKKPSKNLQRYEQMIEE